MEIQTKVFVRESMAQMEFRVTTANHRHISIAIDRKFIRGEDAEIHKEEDDVMSSHSNRTANARYGWDGALVHQLSAHS